MTEDRGISGLHKVTGIRGIGSAHTSPKAVVKKKAKKPAAEEKDRPAEGPEEESPKKPSISIKA